MFQNQVGPLGPIIFDCLLLIPFANISHLARHNQKVLATLKEVKMDLFLKHRFNVEVKFKVKGHNVFTKAELES